MGAGPGEFPGHVGDYADHPRRKHRRPHSQKGGAGMNQKELLRAEIDCVLNRNDTEKFMRHILTVALAYERALREAGHRG